MWMAVMAAAVLVTLVLIVDGGAGPSEAFTLTVKLEDYAAAIAFARSLEGVDPELVVGAATEVIAGENMIVTAGGIDSHIHFISPQQVYEALSNGITILVLSLSANFARVSSCRIAINEGSGFAVRMAL